MEIKAKNLDKALNAIVEFCRAEGLESARDELLMKFSDAIEEVVGEDVYIDMGDDDEDDEDESPVDALDALFGEMEKETIRAMKDKGMTTVEIVQFLLKEAIDASEEMGDPGFADFSVRRMMKALVNYKD